MISLDVIFKGLFLVFGVGIIFYFASWIKSVRIQEAQNEKDHIEIDIAKLKDKFNSMPLDDLLTIENESLRDRRAKHKTPKGE